MQKEFDFLVFIGRFQPLHSGHAKVIQEAIDRADKVIVCIGSAFKPRDDHNPWTFDERANMISDAFPEVKGKNRLHITPILDLDYNNQGWASAVRMSVNGIMAIERSTPNPKVGLIGFSKDHTSFYLNMFPEWDSINVDQKVIYNATDIRNAYFNPAPRIPSDIIPDSVTKFLKEFLETPDYMYVYEETKFVLEHKKRWSVAPYPPTFVTVDAIVVQSGHILLIKRRSAPGKGLWALPGGYINQEEYIEDAMIRELREETLLKVPDPVLRGNINHKFDRVFDGPKRSSRGRVITHAFLIELPAREELPKVKGADDASKAKWVPIADVDPMMMFEDHYAIIQNMTGGI